MDYFELVLDMVENLRDYDVVGHLDYIPRYGPMRISTMNMGIIRI